MAVNHEGKPIDVQTLTDSGVAAKERFPSVDAARSLFTQYRHALVNTHVRDARVIVLHRGEPPYESKKLEALGQGWRANINTREMKGSINNRVNAAYDFHMDVDTRILVHLRPQYKDYQTPDPQEDWGKVIAEEYTYMLNVDWPENYLLIDQVTRDRVKLGLGVAVWSDHLDWRPQRIPKIECFFDPKYPPVPEKIPVVCVRDTLLIEDMLKQVRNPDSAAKLGWTVAALKDALAAFWKLQPGSTEPAAVSDGVVGAWAAFEQWMASHPSDVAVFELKEMPVIRYLVKAVETEKITHYIDVDPSIISVVLSDFLYKRTAQFDSMAQAIWFNPYDYGEGTFASIDGLGHDLSSYCEVSNRMVGQALDGGTMSAGLLLQAQAGFDADELSVLRVGPTTVIPPGLQAINTAFTPPIERVLDLRSAVRGITANNVGMTRLHPEQMDVAARGTRSRDEVALERNREFRMETNSANFEYLMWSNLHREMFRRALALRKSSDSVPGAKEAKAFVQRCLERGVPEILLEAAERALVVTVNRAIGDGSREARSQAWGQLMSLRGEMDEAGRRHTVREYTSTLIGYERTDAVFPLWNRNKIPSNEISIATLENNDFREGSPVPAGSDQIHVLHIDTHLPMLMEMARTYNEAPDQTDVPTLLRTFAAALPHVQEHLEFLARDETRKAYVNQVMDLLRELVVLYRRVERDAATTMTEQQQLAQQRQQQVMDEMQNRMDGETQVKLRKVELDAQIEAMRQNAIAEVRATKAQAQDEIRRWSAEAKADLDRSMADRKAALEEEIAQRKMSLVERTQ